MITAPNSFQSPRIYLSFLATVPPPLIVGLGLTLVIAAGEIDLSLPVDHQDVRRRVRDAVQVRGLPARPAGGRRPRPGPADLAVRAPRDPGRRRDRLLQRRAGRGHRHPLDHRHAVLAVHLRGPVADHRQRPAVQHPRDRLLLAVPRAFGPLVRHPGAGGLGPRPRGGDLVGAQPAPVRRAPAVHRRQPGRGARAGRQRRAARSSSCSR